MVRSKNTDTKCKDVFHPYNTRSSRKHQKNYIQLQDNTSLPGSSNAVVVKDKPAAGGPAVEISRGKQRSRPKNHKNHHLPGSSSTVVEDRPAGVIIPRALYNCVQAALVSRKEWETKRDKDSKLTELEDDESLVDRIAYFYKHVNPVLPLSWKYNPATASTLVPSDKHPFPILSSSEVPYKETAKTCEDDPPPSVKLPKIYSVPLKEDETESWLQFKKLDEGNPKPVPSVLIGKNFPYNINTEHPFVSVIGSFAFNGFNESYEMFVKKGEHNVLSDPAFRECTYLRSNGSYWFKMTIEAVENGFCCIYQAIVKCTEDNGERTLMEFSLTEVKQGKKGHASKSKSWKDKDEDEDMGETSPPRSKGSKGVYQAYASSMYPNSFGGYDYADPAAMLP